MAGPNDSIGTDFFKRKRIHEERTLGWDSDEARQICRDVTAILDRHFSKFGLTNIPHLTAWFLGEYEVGLSEMWCREDERKKLELLKYQIRKLSEVFGTVHWNIRQEIQGNSTLPLKTLHGAYLRCEEKELTSVSLDDHPPAVTYKALRQLCENFEQLIPAIEKTSQDLPEGIQYKKRAHEAWRLVEAAAELCRAHPDTIDVPRALNPTSPFHRLLDDLFVYFGIETTPEGAFKGWFKHVDNIREDLDLPPIY